MDRFTFLLVFFITFFVAAYITLTTVQFQIVTEEFLMELFDVDLREDFNYRNGTLTCKVDSAVWEPLIKD